MRACKYGMRGWNELLSVRMKRVRESLKILPRSDYIKV